MSLNNLILPFKDLLSADEQKNLDAYVKNINFSENPSFVYNKADTENIIDSEVRKSKTFITNDVNMLQFVNLFMIKRMNQRTKSKYIFSLARDYITFIRYDKGDFFDWHVDFERVRVNNGASGFKEMHFLYCVEAPVSGGQLLIKNGNLNDPLLSSDVTTIQEACTANSAVVFDKLMSHSGAIVNEGTKIIMTIDVNVVSEFRAQSGISLNLENQVSDLMTGKRQWVSFNGDFYKFKQVWRTIYSLNPETFVPFIQIKVEMDDQKYEVHATCEGIIRAFIVRENRMMKTYGHSEYEYLVGDWYYHKIAGEYSPDSEIIKFNKSSEDDDNDAVCNRNYSGENGYDLECLDAERETIGNAFYSSGGDPVVFMTDLIEGLIVNSHNDGLLRKLPKVEWLELDKSIPTVHELPDSIYDDDEWHSVKGGFSYHCNEPEYDEFIVNYRYGIINTLTLV